MSHLEELINELCPNGVEYKKLGEVSEMQRGTSITKQDTAEGDIPVIAGGQKPAYFCDKSNRDGETITIAGSGAYAGYVVYWNTPIFVSDAFSVKGTKECTTKYLYYFLKNIQQKIYSTKKGAGVPHVHINNIDKFLIPVPPLPIQEEIVRILDSFTSLEAELEAELEARKQQYEYFRDKLLTFDNSNKSINETQVVWKTINDICVNICSGGTPSRSISKYYEGNIPWLRTQEVDWRDVYDTELKITQEAISNSSVKLIPANCVIIAMYGATAAKSCINKIPLTTNQACCNLEINEHIATYKYVYYWLCREYENLRALGEGSQSNINGKKIKNYKIPIPPLEEQHRIVSILDKFEKLTTDLTQGLPAEIEARRQQYEYYRDKLLTFKRKTA